LKDDEKSKDAELSTSKSIKLNPNFIGAHFGLDVSKKSEGG